MIIIISVLVIALCVFFAVYLAKQKKIPAKARVINYLKASVNYKVSFMTVADGINYAVINISITNNLSHALENITISSVPALPFINEITVKNPEKNSNVQEHPSVYTSICQEPVRVPSLSFISGYLIVASQNNICPLHEIKISVNDLTDTIHIHPTLIREETTTNRHF